MNNDCQACGHAQAHGRLSISLQYGHKDEDGGHKWQGEFVDLLVTADTKSKPNPAGQERPAKGPAAINCGSLRRETHRSRAERCG
jgi:hypothetical protein